MEYVSYDSLDDRPNIIVDGGGNAATILTLSHWPHSGTPAEFKADTSTEIVLNFLGSPRRAEFEAKTQIVSNNHFDEDGLMSVWAMLNPEKALELRERLIGAATAGDFSRVLDPESAHIIFAINQMAANVDGDKYSPLLPKVEDLLIKPQNYSELWQSDWQRLESDLNLIDSGKVKITEHPQTDLAIIEAPQPIDPMAICSRTDRLRILTIFGEGFYQLQYRYESWVQVVSRVVLPRIDFYPLADRLREIEQVQGTWKYGDTADIMPSLQFVDFEGTPIPSGIPRELVIAEVIRFFELEQENASLQWSPYDEAEPTNCGVVYEQTPAPITKPVLYNLEMSKKQDSDEG